MPPCCTGLPSARFIAGSRRKIQDNGVILRAGDNDDLPAAEAPRPALLDTDPGAETVAARLQRIRARHAGKGVAETVAAGVVTGAVDQTDAYTEDQHAEETARLAAETVLPVTESIEIPDQIEDILDEAENDQALAEFDDSLADLATSQPEAAFDVPEALSLPEAVVEAEPVAAPQAVADLAIGEVPDTEALVAASLIVETDQAAEPSEVEAMLAGLASDLPEDTAPLVDTTGEPVDLPEEFAAAKTGFAETGLDEADLLSRLAAVAPVRLTRSSARRIRPGARKTLTT
jgi:hypothetical protein